MRQRPVYSSRPRYGSQDYVMEGVGVYPEESPFHFTNSFFPYNADTMAAGDLPFGFVSRPFILNSSWCLHGDPTVTMSKSKEVARCTACGGYVNVYCDVSSSRWYCSLCGQRHAIGENQTRYRHGDFKGLPELKDSVAEFKVAFDTEDKVFSVSARERPLVHVFLLQESMSVDAMQSTVDAIATAIECMHPDVHVLLLTYSYRIGIYSLSKQHDGVTIQYSYMGSNTEQGTVEGLDHASNSNAAQILTVPLDDIANFWDACHAVGDCKASLHSAIQMVCDLALSEQSGVPVGEAAPLGSVLLGLYNWLADSSVSKRQRRGRGSPQTLDVSKLWHVFNNEAGLTTPFEPQDLFNHCTGVLVHVFTDRPQPVNSHTMLDDLQLHAADSIDTLSRKFAAVDVSINVWAIASFEGTELGLANVLPLIQRTGGQLHRIVLGVDREQSQGRYAEELTRTLTKRYATRCLVKIRTSPALDTEVISGVGVADPRGDGLRRVAAMTVDSTLGYQLGFRNGVHGTLAEDGMDPSAGLGGNIGRNARERTLTIQMAFSFETLVEDVVRDLAVAPVDSDDMPLSATHCAYIQQALKAMGFPDISDELVREVVQEPPHATNIAQKSTRRRWQLNCSQGMRAHPTHKALHVVKVLRLVTLGLDCTGRTNIYLQSRDPVCTAVLTLRDCATGALDGTEDSADADNYVEEISGNADDPLRHARALVTRTASWGTQEIINRIARVVLAQRLVRLYVSNPNDASRNWNSEDPVDEVSVTIEGRKQQLRDSLAGAAVAESVFLLCGAVLRLLAVVPPSPTVDEVAVMPDNAAVLLYNITTLGAPTLELLLRPDFRAINEDGSLMNGNITLAREGMVRAGSKAFFLDAGREMLLYRRSDRFRRPDDPGIALMPNAPTYAAATDSSIVKMAEHRAAIMQGVVGHVIRRLSQCPLIASVASAEQGTGSAAMITPHLLLDDEASSLSYIALVDFVLDIAASAMQ